MKLVGHKTVSIYHRYAIADEASLREAGEKLTAGYGGQPGAPERKVASLGHRHTQS